MEGVACDYVYLKYKLDLKRQKRVYLERCPASGRYEPGQFVAAHQFKRAPQTVDLSFPEGIEWKAFYLAYQELQGKVASEELAIQAIERQPGNMPIVRLDAPIDMDGTEVEQWFWQNYKSQLAIATDLYTSEGIPEPAIDVHRQRSAILEEIVKVLASRQIDE